MVEQIEEVGKRIEKWLVDEEFRVSSVADENARFFYKVTKDGGVTLSVLQRQNKTDSILIVGDVSLTDEDQKKLATIPEKDRRSMLLDIRMDLLSTKCRWQFIPPTQSWKTIRVSKSIFYDGLSKDRFFETMDIVMRAVLLIVFTFQRKFDITPYTS
jgi:hypothetical protein